MSDAAIGWTIIIGFLFVVGSCNHQPSAPAKYEPETTYTPSKSDKPIKVGDTTYKNEKELIDAVCKADPTVRGCH